MLTILQKSQLNKMVDVILNSPINTCKATKQNQLEMSMVFDESSERDFLQEMSREVAGTLKSHSSVFQNVRCNVVHWTLEKIYCEVMPLSLVQIGKIVINDSEMEKECPLCLDILCEYLKKFHARSQCVIIITQGTYCIKNRDKLIEYLNPFLKSKLLIISDKEIIKGSELMFQKN